MPSTGAVADLPGVGAAPCWPSGSQPTDSNQCPLTKCLGPRARPLTVRTSLANLGTTLIRNQILRGCLPTSGTPCHAHLQAPPADHLVRAGALAQDPAPL